MSDAGQHSAPLPVLALLLPSAFPDLGWLMRALLADRVLLHDTLPFSRKSRVHRGLIRTPDGTHWIHLPVHPSDRRLPLCEARLDDTSDWFTPLWRALEYNYRNSLYFDHYESEIRADLEQVRDTGGYLEAVYFLNRRMSVYLELGEAGSGRWTPVSQAPVRSTFGTVWQESGSSRYHAPVRTGLPEIAGDGLPPPETEGIEWRQHFGGFVPGCCWLDLLFACGPDSWRILRAAGWPPAP